MLTPHSRNSRGTALTNVPGPWWKQKQNVADKVGNALLISLAPPTDVRRVVGLYQQRSTDSAPDDVQLKTAASKREGASIKKLELGDALDGTRWRLIPHFFDTVFEAQGDQAKAIDTEESSGSITGIKAVLTMAGQPPSEAKVFPLQIFLNAWVPEEELDAAPAPAETAEVEEVDTDVEEPNGG